MAIQATVENGRQARSDMPLLSRLDHLDYIMKSLEGKQNIHKLRSDNLGGDQGRSSGFSAKEAYFKGSLLDRVGALEHRLLQLSVQFDVNNTPNGLESSSQESKKEQSSTLPSVNNNSNQIREIQEVPCEKKQNKPKKKNDQNNPSEKKQQSAKNKSKKEPKKTSKEVKKEPKKTSKEVKRGTRKPSWLRLRILGC
ncbi:hypothetical protein ACFE04_012834 [Oxalis oulophora]